MTNPSVKPTSKTAVVVWDDTNKKYVVWDAVVMGPLAPTKYDYISLSYTGSDLTGVVFKTGGSGGTTIATLTLAYTDGNLTSVTKS